MRQTLHATRPCVVGPGEGATRDQLGGKGYGLQELTTLGFTVPRWIALTTDAAEVVLASLRQRINAIVGAIPPGDVEATRCASVRIGQLVRGADWPNWLRSELREWVQTLRTEHGLAVRSSAVGEDSAENSYAGQLATLLFVPTDEVESVVRDCWAAAFSERALLYRQAKGLADRPVRMAIVIQEMVQSHVSGVAFTADPMTGAPRHVVVAGYGLGEGVVADLVETDSFTRDVGSESWQCTVRKKTRQVVARGSGMLGTEIAAVPPENRDRPTLTDAQLESLSAALTRIEDHAGRPQDVEWAFSLNATLHILQARPISVVPGGELAIWDDSNIGESYPGLTLPLTYSFVRYAYERLFAQALCETGVSRRTIESVRPALRHLVGVIRGRLYLNLMHYYHLFGVVPGLALAVRKWEVALGITNHFDIARLREKRPWRRALFKVLALRTGLRFAARLIRLDLEVVDFHDRVNKLIHRYEDADFSARSFDDLLRAYERISEEFLDGWSLLIYNDLFAFLFDDRLGRLCGADVPALGRLGSGTDLHRRLLCGLAAIESVAPLRSVLRLVEEVRKEPAVAELIRSSRTPEEVWVLIGENGGTAGFRAKAEEHLQRYGERTIEELKLETQPLSDTPWVLVSILRNYLNLGIRLGDENKQEDGIQKDAEQEFRRLFRGNPLKKMYALWILHRTRRCVAERENMSFARCRAYGILRRLFRAMGDALAREGALREAQDVFYLTLDDLDGYARGGLPEADLVLLVALRRVQYALFAKEELSHRIVCRGSIYPHSVARALRRSVAGSSDTLHGVPCSPGVVRGVARVLHSPSPAEKVDGEILVTPVTEPGWVFLMVAARGLVVERGSILSHAAIIGRELGIPTIVGAEGATTRISSGDEIEMDGGTGAIRILQNAEPVPGTRPK